MLNDALDQAKYRIRRHYLEKYRGNNIFEAVPKFDFQEKNIDFLAHYWIRDRCSDAINNIMRKTGCKTLQEYLVRLTNVNKIEKLDL